MTGPDYGAYTLEELLDVERHIVRDQFPDRYARICELIKLREAAPEERRVEPVVAIARSRSALRKDWILIATACAIVVAAAVGAVIAVSNSIQQATNRELRFVMAKVTENFPDLAVTITIAGKRLNPKRTIIVSLENSTWSQLDEEPRKAKANELARIARKAHPNWENVTEVRVIIPSEGAVESDSTEPTNAEYSFLPSDLR